SRYGRGASSAGFSAYTVPWRKTYRWSEESWTTGSPAGPRFVTSVTRSGSAGQAPPLCVRVRVIVYFFDGSLRKTAYSCVVPPDDSVTNRMLASAEKRTLLMRFSLS